MPDENQSSVKKQGFNPSFQKPAGSRPVNQGNFQPKFSSGSFNKPLDKPGPPLGTKPSWSSPPVQTKPFGQQSPVGQPQSEPPISPPKPSFGSQETTFKRGFEPQGILSNQRPQQSFQKPAVPPFSSSPEIKKPDFEKKEPLSVPSSAPWEKQEPVLETKPPEIKQEPFKDIPLSSSKEATMAELTAEESSGKGGLKKILPFLLIFILLVLAGLAIYKFVLPRFQKPKEVTLTYWGLWESETVMKGVLDEWEKKNPNIKVNYIQQSPKEYRERLQSALARNQGPDIFRYHISWMPMLKNEVAPIPSDVMTTADFESTYYPVIKENLRLGTSYVGLPLGIDTLALFYNEDIFQAAGKTPPTSWDQLRQTAIELTTHDESGRIQTAGVALGTTSNVEHWSDILGLMMLQNGVDLANPTSQLAQDALIYYTIFNKTDNVWNETLPSSTIAFATGKVAMYFGYSWDIFELKNINPNLKFKVVEIPQLPDTEVNWASFWVEGVSKRSQASKESWEFLKFLSSKETLQKLYQTQSQTRLFGELYPRMDMAGLLSTNNLVIPFITQASQAKTWYLCSRTHDNGINDRMIKYFEDAVNSVNSGNSPDDVLSITAQGVSQLLSQYGIGSYQAR